MGRRALWLLQLLGACAYARLACPLLEPVLVDKIGKEALRPHTVVPMLRGGEAAAGGETTDEEDQEDLGDFAPHPAATLVSSKASEALLDSDVMQKLNQVPVFCFLADGQVIGVRNDKGEDIVSFHVDADEAREKFAALKEANMGMEVRMGALPLGAALDVCGGWGRKPISDDCQTRRLCPSPAHVDSYGEMLRQQLIDAGRDPGTWQLPIFMCNEFQTERMIPVFFSREDLAAGWERAGRDKAKLPESILVMDLRVFCEQLQSGMPGADKVQLVSSVEAFNLAQELSKQAK